MEAEKAYDKIQISLLEELMGILLFNGHRVSVMMNHQALPSLGFSRQERWSGVAIAFSNAWKWKVKVKSLSRVRLLETPWTAAYQALLFMGFSRQDYWSESPVPSPSSMLRAYYVPGTFLSALHLVIHLIFRTT